MMEEGVGFEPTLAYKTSTVFKTVAIGLSANPPKYPVLRTLRHRKHLHDNMLWGFSAIAPYAVLGITSFW